MNNEKITFYVEEYNKKIGELWLDFTSEEDLKEFIHHFNLKDNGNSMILFHVNPKNFKRKIYKNGTIEFTKEAFYGVRWNIAPQSEDMPALILCEVN